MKNHTYIYADNSATTPLAPEALEAMMPFLTKDYYNASSLYSLSRTAKDALSEARSIIATCIGALPEEILFTSGGTESDNWAIKGRMISGRILASRIEHHAVLNSLSFSSYFPHGAARLLPVDRFGFVSSKTLESFLSNRVSLVSVMLANNEIGTIEPVKELAEISHHHKTLFHTDAVQAVGHIPVDVNELGIDFLSASAHKFHGPKGIGFLFHKKDVGLDKFMDGGQQEFGLRAGTENVASIVGMASALRVCCEQMASNSRKLKDMVICFKEIIRNALPQASFNGDSVNRLPGHISLSIPGISGEGLLHFLDLRGIAVSTGAACNSKSTRISHVLKAIHLPSNLANGTVRISFGMYNKKSDADYVAQAIIDYCRKVKF